MNSSSGETDPAAAENPLADVSTFALIDQFYASEADPLIGRELGIRLLKHAGFSGDPEQTPLIDSSGRPVEQAGKPLMLADYVNFAASNHLTAVPSILAFLSMQPGSRDYLESQKAIQNRIRGGR